MAQTKRFGLGLVLGKFLPPHAGHIHLIEFARQRCERVVVLACSLKREPIDGTLRARWLREIFAHDPGIEVVHVTDENPQEPHEHPDFWSIWRETVRRACPAYPQAIFTSESYGEPFARVLDMEHVSCDSARQSFPVSGTQVRQDPMRFWQFIPPAVRPWFAKRVVVYGPESTGKTTLAQNLARHFETAWVPEFARGYLDRQNALRSPSQEAGPGFVVAADIQPIARGQLASEDELARQANRLLICDTDLKVTKVYSEFYFGGCPDWIKLEAARRRYDLYLFCDTDTPWVSDSQRDQGSPAQRAHMRELFLRELEGCPVVMISGGWEARLEKAILATEQLLVSKQP